MRVHSTCSKEHYLCRDCMHTPSATCAAKPAPKPQARQDLISVPSWSVMLFESSKTQYKQSFAYQAVEVVTK